MFYICNPNFLLILSISIGCIIALLLLILTLFFAPQKFSHEKNNPYECGFQPFEDSRSKFDVKYYLVAILYIIFDLELMFLLP
jgi:NADH-quinone oxidoreductase subunit A